MLLLRLAALSALVLFAQPVRAAASFDLSPGPYHYGGTVTVTTHGDYKVVKTRVRMLCHQDGALVYGEFVDHPLPDTPYVFHFGLVGSNQWDMNGGGAADCDIRFDEDRPPYHHYGQLFFHVEA